VKRVLVFIIDVAINLLSYCLLLVGVVLALLGISTSVHRHTLKGVWLVADGISLILLDLGFVWLVVGKDRKRFKNNLLEFLVTSLLLP